MPGIWRKRFAEKTDPLVLEFTDSISDDERLAEHDISASLAHVRMLGRCGILTSKEESKLAGGLKAIRAEQAKGKFRLKQEFEDVHMNVEKALGKTAGETGQKLHTARSRNDLVAADLRLYARQVVLSMIRDVVALEKKLLQNAKKHGNAVIPGYTHLQQAQPVLWSFYLLCHISRFQRDIEGLRDCLKRVNVSPLGSCALAGTSHDIDPELTASYLGFPAFASNAMDAVSDRDFLCEISSRLVQIMLHISGFAEDIVIYGSQEFGLVEFDDAVATGSSIMPHKKNPDVCELLRAKAGKVIGNHVGLLTILKGLPSSYNRDLQETKTVFFGQVDETAMCLRIAATVAGSVSPRKSDWAHQPNFICATDIVDHMVRNGFAFREAYNIIAECVRDSRGDVHSFGNLCAEKSGMDPALVARMLKPIHSVEFKKSKGGTSPKQTAAALLKAEKSIAQTEAFLKKAASS